MPPPLSSSTTLKRIHREIADLKKEDLGSITLAPSDENLFNWTATIPGPEGSVYEDGLFHVEITLAHDYPFSAPRVTFRTRIYHMNINERGNICIDILKHNWSPALSLFKVILSISSLLTDPNPKDPLVPSIATEYVRNRPQHNRTARKWTELYARPPPAPSSAKGKGKATASPAPVPAATSRAGPAGSTRTQAITIDDSDEEGRVPHGRAVGAKRKRERTQESGGGAARDGAEPPARRRRTARAPAADDVIVIED
ncbi:ubiquitin-conjugating enzyme/RWD-like protein [Fomitopsis serialis]|uniref:ubiquitin-conjugating enzyme/RWD-like protein n=1 Tax=Fomitopsis serialis TaxID=139415 RepID=UPI0020085F72|nr:ubiquitin-conjugating enzyme/RWD-like protein [Neoantrodia serialis]KAH9912220.1 ubiquitin-conjugating enzyme/RWD-like protein [Neoantrodia serialis]